MSFLCFNSQERLENSFLQGDLVHQLIYVLRNSIIRRKEKKTFLLYITEGKWPKYEAS